MSGIELLVEDSQKLTDIFCYWPSFHDAEIIELNFWRGDVDAEKERFIFPVLTVKFHLWELTKEVDPEGCLVRRHHTLATLRFHDVDEFKMEGFNHQNAIFGLSIISQERGVFTNGEKLPPYLVVKFEPAFGIMANFQCFRIEVVTALQCNDDALPELKC